MKYTMAFGDTVNIAVANIDRYKSFVSEDWSLDSLYNHFLTESQKNNILVFQMSNEGIEHSWEVDINISDKTPITNEFFRKAEGSIEVTNDCLYLVDYDCLTMAAQFEDEQMPDANCAQYKIDIPNGLYKVTIIQYYDVDKDERFGNEEIDIGLTFSLVHEDTNIINTVFWWNI